ncbi:MAG: DUF4266 domain-containing protein [Leptothrix ochracea]|jgi:hypothetical protein|uniref:DUF4266 domain-containing protein n=1 Tax=Leptothrix ochracea TaxID=735331 RepID=UPI0034E1ADD8
MTLSMTWQRRVGVASVMLVALLAGCSTFQPPQPWEKADLAKKEMTMETDALDQGYVQHIYSSKENASGGYGVGGGGCGCN